MGTSQRISASHTTQLNSNLHYASLLTISDCWSWPSCRRPRTLWSSSGSCPYPCQADCWGAVQDRVHHSVGHRVCGEGDPGVCHQVCPRVQDGVCETVPAHNQTSVRDRV